MAKLGHSLIFLLIHHAEATLLGLVLLLKLSEKLLILVPWPGLERRSECQGWSLPHNALLAFSSWDPIWHIPETCYNLGSLFSAHVLFLCVACILHLGWMRCCMGSLCVLTSSSPYSTIHDEIIMLIEWGCLPYYGTTTLTVLPLFFNFFNLGMSLEDDLRVCGDIICFNKEFGLFVFIPLSNL